MRYDVFLNQGNYIAYNKSIAQLYGRDCAILIGFLAYKYSYWKERGEVTEDDYFYVTRSDIEEETMLSEYEQRCATKILMDNEILLVKKVGLPAKNYYKVDDDKLLNAIATSAVKIKPLLTQKLNITNKTITNKSVTNNIKENILKENDDIVVEKRSVFKPPTIEEIKEYCNERHNNIDAETFFNYYESKGWVVGKTKMKNWKAAIITWERNDKARQSQTKEPPKKFSESEMWGKEFPF